MNLRATLSATQAKRRAEAGACARDALWRASQVGTPEPGKYRIALDSDDPQFGGPARVGHGAEHFTHPEGQPGARGPRTALPVPARQKQTVAFGRSGSGQVAAASVCALEAGGRWGGASTSSACRACSRRGRRARTKLSCGTYAPLARAGVPEGNFNNRAFSMLVSAPSRSVVVYERVPEG